MSATVCVTGASGFLGSHIVAALLGHSFHVIALVRDPNSRAAQQLRTLPQRDGAQLEVVAGDIRQRGALHTAIGRSRYVVHSAAIVADYASGRSRAQEILDVNVAGTENLLEAVEQAPGVEKVVHTSSMSAVISYQSPSYCYSESDWNTSSLEASDPYTYSKTRAERVLVDRFESSERLRGKKLVRINPPIVIGPALSPQHARTSLQIIDGLDRGTDPGVPNLYLCFTDVRDVARVHAQALANPQIEGRFLMPGHSTSLGALTQMMRKLAKDSKAPERVLPNWLVYASAPLTRRLSLQFLRRHLGVEFKFNDARLRAQFPDCYRGLEQTVLDSIKSVRELRQLAA